MSSADIWRVELPSRISRIFRRGSVTFKPALRRSLPSTRTLQRTRDGALKRRAMRDQVSFAGMIILHRTRERLLSVSAKALALHATTLDGCVQRLNIQQDYY